MFIDQRPPVEARPVDPAHVAFQRWLLSPQSQIGVSPHTGGNLPVAPAGEGQS